MTEQRRLAAILVADVVGYSKLIGSDEAGTLAQLEALRTEIIEPQIARHAGRLFKSVGDGFLIEFASAVQAVSCAKAIQEANGMGRLPLRIGIHVGDVVVQGDDLMGDGVNVAARVEGIAEPGGIAITRAVHEQVRDKLDLGFMDKGEIELKNIQRPVQVFVLGGAKVGSQTTHLPLPDKPSIAVLPFQNMSGDAEQEYFVDGLVEDMTTALSRFKSLFVIARNSSFTYKGKVVDIKQVGRELGVRYVLEGSVRRAGDRVRITGQLIDAMNGAHLWADRFDAPLEDVFELQDRVTTSVVGAIIPKLDAAEVERAKRKPFESLDAYDCLLRAQSLFLEFSKETMQHVLSLIYRAIELDPEYSAPYGLACRCISAMKLYRWGFDPSHHEAEVRRLADRVRVFGQDDAYALSYAAFALVWVSREHDLGMSFADKAVSVNPNLALSWLMRGATATFLGKHDEALKSLELTTRISPVGVDFYVAHAFMAFAHLFLGDYPKSIAAASTSISYMPTWLVPLLPHTAAEALTGDMCGAGKSLAKLRALNPDLRLSTIDRAYPYRPGDVARLREGLRLAGLPE
jgi:adenylate cyclase